jgi:hypothetical protein
MNAYDPTSPHETLPGRPVSGVTSEPPVTGSEAKQPHRSWVRRLLSSKKHRWIVAACAVLVCAVIGLSVGLTTSHPATATSSSATAGHPRPGSGAAAGGGSNARSGPAAGGSSGTVDSVSTSSFTMSTSAGQQVTVNEASTTTYRNGTGASSASAVAAGEPVVVLGTTSGTTITATQITVQPVGGVGTAATSAAAGVVPFQQGAPSTAKQAGQIPANDTEGDGTNVSGTPANKATEAALAAYPGGVVDRVVQLSNGEYEVHYIGVNWPHHIFVNQNFTVVGAD